MGYRIVPLPALCLVDLCLEEIRVEDLLLLLEVLLGHHLRFELLNRPEGQVVTGVHPYRVHVLLLIYFQLLGLLRGGRRDHQLRTLIVSSRAFASCV